MGRRVNWAFAAFASLCALALSQLWLGRGGIPTIFGVAFVTAPFVATAGLSAGLASWLLAPKAEAGPGPKRRGVSWRTCLLTWLIFSTAIGPAILVETAMASGGPPIAEGGSFLGYWVATFLISTVAALPACLLGGALFLLVDAGLARLGYRK